MGGRGASSPFGSGGGTSAKSTATSVLTKTSVTVRDKYGDPIDTHTGYATSGGSLFNVRKAGSEFRIQSGDISSGFIAESGHYKTETEAWKGIARAAGITQPIPTSRVRVSDSSYRFNHGKRPSGNGHWAFDIGGKTVFFSGKYSDAKKKAIKEAAKRGESMVRLGT